jgi:hypothetical protein
MRAAPPRKRLVAHECSISPQGKVTRIEVPPLLEEAAADAVEQWEYEPTLVDGVAVPIIMTVTVSSRCPDATRAPRSSGVRASQTGAGPDSRSRPRERNASGDSP